LEVQLQRCYAYGPSSLLKSLHWLKRNEHVEHKIFSVIFRLIYRLIYHHIIYLGSQSVMLPLSVMFSSVCLLCVMHKFWLTLQVELCFD